MQGRDGQIETWHNDGVVWVSADSSSFPPWNLVQLDSANLIEKLDVSETKEVKHTMFWAWIDEAECIIRARTFAADWDIIEAEGNGSGAMMLAVQLKRRIEIKHGEGSVAFAEDGQHDKAKLGGRVVRLNKT